MTDAVAFPGRRSSAPEASSSPLPARGYCAVPLGAHAMVLLRAIAAFEKCDNSEAVLMALASHARSIGLSRLARAVLEARQGLEDASRAGPRARGDLTGVPDFARSTAIHFGRRKAI